MSDNQWICLILIILVVVLAVLWSMNNIIANVKKYTKSERLNEKIGGGPLQDLKNLVGTFDVSNKKPLKNLTVDKPTLAERLTDAGWKLYIKQSCPWCHLQIDMFGSDSMYLDIVDCTSEDLRPEDLKNCGQTWVYPTWIKDDYILPGSQSFADLNKALKSYQGTVSRKEYKQMKRDNV
jgi:hypothetical protein